METDEATSKTSVTSSSTDVLVKEEPMETTEEKPTPPPEPVKNYEIINNPCRALNQQLKVLRNVLYRNYVMYRLCNIVAY